MIARIKRPLRRSVGFRFDAMAAFLMCQQHGVDLDGLDSIPRGEYVTSWVWNGHKSYCIYGHKKPMEYDKMKRFISHIRKSDWDSILEAMVKTQSPKGEGNDKKKVQPGTSFSSPDGKQE